MLVSIICFFVFFFKQKTAYEMRISDWSSDVCSSDLEVAEQLRQVEDDQGDRQQAGRLEGVGHRPVRKQVALDEVAVLGLRLAQRLEAGEHQDRKSVV